MELGTPDRDEREVRPKNVSASLEERAQKAIVAQEILRDVARLKIGGPIGTVVWLAFGVFDYIHATYVGLGDVNRLWTIRLVGAGILALLSTIAFLIRDAVRFIGVIETGFVLSGVVMTTCVSFMCLETGGFESLYAAGILLSSFAMILMPRPFTKTLVWMPAVLFPYLVVMFGSTYFVPETRAQLLVPRAMAYAAGFTFVGIADGVFLGVVSHILWSMRRELYESRSVGRYRVKRLLGKGGMGEVYAAYHHGLRRDVAVKVLKAATDDELAAKRFEREIHATSGLSHPNTVRLFDFGVAEDGRLYYAMELLDGETLKRLIAREGKLDEARAIHLVLQASHALAEAHARGIVHRDVKPENLFVTRVGDDPDFVKVLDFGIASVHDDPRYAVTRTGSIAGTPGTMSPEVIVGQPATPASDVYALGAVLYLLLTGTLPFGEDSSGATLVAHVHDPVVPPSVRRQEALDRRLEAIVLRCLEKSPLDRYRDARELARVLEAVARAGSRGGSPRARNPAPSSSEVPLDDAERDEDDAATRKLPARDDLH